MGIPLGVFLWQNHPSRHPQGMPMAKGTKTQKITKSSPEGMPMA